MNKLNDNVKSVKSHNPHLDARLPARQGGQARKSVVQTSYDIVKAHGGTIEFESRSGKGSEFIIVIS